MVANLAYLERVTHDPGPNVLFVKAHGDPVATAHRIAVATRAHGTLVKNITQQTAQTVSSITTVDLGRDQQDRGGVRAPARLGGDGVSSSRSRLPSADRNSRR